MTVFWPKSVVRIKQKVDKGVANRMNLKKIEKFFIYATVAFVVFIFSLFGYYYYLVSIGAIER